MESEGIFFQWFTSYLSCRTQKVMYKDKLLSSACLYAAVPQGFVLCYVKFLF